ncbi:MAG: hypothetical protein OQK76_04400 [Gammaproteobacteria bacterium]|nr:hypothetical protein [Gammaproteobacteria bacterium]MCW8909845.1 hypothetical protein [Gammaproteobacteria bacterium]
MIKFLISFILLHFIVVTNASAEELASINELKTFFTTSSERSKLNEMRRSGNFGAKQPDARSSISIEPKKVKVRGVMMRENGEPVVWVNEGSTLKSRKIDDISVNTRRIKPAASIPLRINNRHLTMKPGQEWTESSNKIKDSYQTK